MLTFSLHNSRFNNLSVFPEKPKLAQFIPRIYNKNYYKSSRVFLGRYTHTYPSPEIFISPQTYTSPSIPLDTYTSLPYPVSPEPTSIAVDITLSSHPLSSPTLPPIGDTIIDFVSELGALPARRPRAPRIHRVLHPSVPSAPSAPFEIAHDPIDKLDVYSRLRPKRNIKTSSCGTY